MSFQSEVRAAAKRINATVDETGQFAVVQWFDGTVELTPADTGRLTGNWQVSIGSPITSTIERKGSSGPKADIKRVVKKPGNYWLVNNLPYAAVAEYGRWGTGPGATDATTRDGFSVQAPYGMARVNLIKTRAKIRRLGVK